MNHRMKARGNWCWDYFQVSNGLELELHERLKVISLVDRSKRARNNRQVKLSVGDKCYIQAHPAGLELIKLGSGNTNYHTMEGDAQEGVHFKLIEGEVVDNPNEQAREMREQPRGAERNAAYDLGDSILDFMDVMGMKNG